MIKKHVLECDACWAQATIEFDNDDGGDILEVTHCPFCGGEIEKEEDDFDDVDEEDDM